MRLGEEASLTGLTCLLEPPPEGRQTPGPLTDVWENRPHSSGMSLNLQGHRRLSDTLIHVQTFHNETSVVSPGFCP